MHDSISEIEILFLVILKVFFVEQEIESYPIYKVFKENSNWNYFKLIIEMS